MLTMRINATSLKNHLGRYLASSIREPVIIEKSGRASAVLISFERFEKLSQYEDFYWSMQAAQAEKGGYLGIKETANRLQKYAQRSGISIEDENETTRHHKTS
jgi:prevent-host-death family protein